MICIYDPQDRTYSGYGKGVLHPQSCRVREVAGGTYEVELVMPITEDDRWMMLKHTAVLRVPVPCVTTPQLELLDHEAQEGLTVRRVVFGATTETSARYLNIRAQSTLASAILCAVPEFTELITTGQTDHDGEWIQVIAFDGVCGWCPLYYTEYVRDYEAASGGGEVVASRQIRDQFFRIYATSKSVDGKTVTARARHIFYDLMYNAVADVDLEYPVPAVAASQQLLDALENREHGFRILTDLDRTVTGSWRCANGVSMLLDPGHGLAALLRARVVRDNFDIFLLENTQEEAGLTIRYRKNLIGAEIDLSDDAVYTRFVPLGLDGDGNLLRLPEGYIDSPHLADYPIPRIKMWQVNGAQIGGKVAQEDGSTKTLDQEDVYGLLREAAEKEIEAGADEVQCKVRVLFIDLGKTVEFAHVGILQTVNLYDWVTVMHGPYGIQTHMQVVSYEYDCLTDQYENLTLGDVFADRTAGVI